MDDLQIVYLLIAGIIGTVTSIALGWSESEEPFTVKKAVSSLIRGIIGAAIYVIANYALEPTVISWDYIRVAIFAAGFDALVKRTQGAIETRTVQK